MILVADSGSTKTEWLSDDGLSVQTQGINPVRDTKEEILHVLRTELVPCLYANAPTHTETQGGNVSQIYFYGSGCISPFINNVSEALAEVFPQARANVQSDLLGAVRALFGREEGIACILGTGSNSCLCKDGEIVSNVSPLGYILGDEGSGAVLGRTLISEMLKGKLTHLWSGFSAQYDMSVADIIDNVYRKPQANRFLSSLVPFIGQNIGDEKVEDMVVGEFVRFLERNPMAYERKDLPVGFVGGLAASFGEQLQKACNMCNLTLGPIIRRPATKMLEYHCTM